MRGQQVINMMIRMGLETADLLKEDKISLKEVDKRNKLADKVYTLFNKRDEEFLTLCDKIEDEDITRQDAFVMLCEHLSIN